MKPRHFRSITVVVAFLPPARSLQRAFRRVLGRSPLRYLKDCRLDAARRDLVSADPAALSVTEVAYRYGFAHLSRFAETYRAEFGERPSETLRRAQS